MPARFKRESIVVAFLNARLQPSGMIALSLPRIDIKLNTELVEGRGMYLSVTHRIRSVFFVEPDYNIVPQ